MELEQGQIGSWKVIKSTSVNKREMSSIDSSELCWQQQHYLPEVLSCSVLENRSVWKSTESLLAKNTIILPAFGSCENEVKVIAEVTDYTHQILILFEFFNNNRWVCVCTTLYFHRIRAARVTSRSLLGTTTKNCCRLSGVLKLFTSSFLEKTQQKQ